MASRGTRPAGVSSAGRVEGATAAGREPVVPLKGRKRAAQNAFPQARAAWEPEWVQLAARPRHTPGRV
ncbi:Membrane protein (fragment) [Candidatus Bipolaricaulis anaerobius]|uniref:Membrane protein n=1 Tax=Candidatus Bipolaricaulis anaerobius TaxID=2026885 RepID=A0A2X3KXZ2_9BACT